MADRALEALSLQALPLHCADRVDLISALASVISHLPLPRVLPSMQVKPPAPPTAL